MFTSSDLEQYLEDLKQITSQDSQSGDLDGLDYVIKFFQRSAQNYGLQSHIIENTPQSGPLLLITNIDNNQDTFNLDVLMIAHLDTVYPKGEALKRPFKIEGNRVLAPGCVDNKGGALLGLYAMKHLVALDSKIALLLNVNEEVGSLGSREIIKKIASTAKNTLVLEPAREDGSLVDKRYGTVEYEITITGNGGNIFTDSNIDTPMTEFANILRQLSTLKGFNNNLKINIYDIKTNSNEKNIVSHSVSMKIYGRYLDSYGLKLLNSKLDNIKNKKLSGNISVELREINHYNALEHKSNARILKRIIDVEAKRLNIQIGWQTSFGGSDGCFASLTCDRVIDGMGPVGGKFHTEEEYLLVDSIVPRGNLLINVINKLSKENQYIKKNRE